MMIRKERNYYLLLLIFLIHFSVECSGVTIEYITPSRGGFQGGDIIQVYGVGFTTFNEVVCVFDDRWAGFSGEIVKDTLVRCVVPDVDPANIPSLPYYTSLELVFDGTSEYTYLASDKFLLGPTITNISPTSGFVQGGNTVTISGTNFGDFDETRVYFDQNECSLISKTNTQIQCKVPEGSFNQNALVTVFFDFNRQFYLHSSQTYHYGPLLTTVTPGCGSLTGGTFVTITGENLDDPVISYSQYPEGVEPTVEISFPVNDDDDDSYAGDTRYFGINPSFDGTQIVFQTPNVDEAVFGEQVRIFVQFKGDNGKVAVTPKNAFRYGPIVYNIQNLPPGKSSVQNPTPSSGHAGGGDSITIIGCGFSGFPTSLISPVIVQNGVTKPLCNRGAGAGSGSDSVRITSCDDGTCEQLICTTAALDCDAVNSTNAFDKVYVQFRPSNFTLYPNFPYVEPGSDEAPLAFALGPQVTGLSASAGLYTGGESLTINGQNFNYAAGSTVGWKGVVVNFNGIGRTISAAGLIQSDTQIVINTPGGYFNYDATVTLDFSLPSGNTSCTHLPRSTSFNYHFGPQCTGVSPSNGYYTGGSIVSAVGQDLTFGIITSAISAKFCLHRLNPNGTCNVFETVTDSSLFTFSNTDISFPTPSYRNGITTNVGGNRIFGDVADVYLFFGGVPSAYLNNPLDQNVYCGTYEFGAKIKRINPTKGPIGPIDGDGIPVAISGLGFSDPFYEDNVVVALGSSQAISLSISDSVINVESAWGGYSGEDEAVSVIFNPCNTTSSSSSVHWGPKLTSITGLNGLTQSISAYNPNGDIYGALPQGYQTITINGVGFEEFITYYINDESYIYEFDGVCYVDGVLSPDNVAVLVNQISETTASYSLVCTLPPRPFGTEAEVKIAFGTICGSVIPDYRSTLTASQKVFYTPRIDYFTPVYGLTSGGIPVTVVGEGFNGWEQYTCYFGHYTNGIEITDVSISGNGTSIQCETPYHRGEFNTDVTVHIQLTREYDQKVYARKKYHYGPICNDIFPNSGYIFGGYEAEVRGDGFIDCTTSFNAPFFNCTFSTFEVFFSDPLDSSNLVKVNITNNNTTNLITNTTFDILVPKGSCMFEPDVLMFFPDANVTFESQRYVACENPDRDYFFHYGPLFDFQFSQYYRNGISYGWKGDIVTIHGLNFADTNISAATCFFGNTSASPTTLINDTALTCTAPTGAWDSYENITVTWNVCQNTTALVAEKFHYGPVLDSSSPSRGYVLNRTTIRITGFAFECCGITNYTLLWPSGAQANASLETQFISPNSVLTICPANNNIDNQIEYFGVIFNGTQFTNTSGTYLTHTEDGGYLTYYYGPYVYDVSPKTSSLSGRGDSVTITGEGFLDPYFTATFCDFLSITGGFDDIGSLPVTPINDTTIVCPVKTFNHECGDLDNVRPRWTRIGTSYRQELGHTYYKTQPNRNRPFVSANQLPYFIDVGSTTPAFVGPVAYGPVILSIEDISNSSQQISSSQFNVPLQGGSTFKITFDNLSDWISQNNDFGSGLAMCRFGNRLTALSPIVNNTVTCTVPAIGEVGWDVEGLIEVILDPHVDGSTTFEVSNPSYHWHWLPYAESFSKNLVQTAGREVVVIEGGGFCDYDSVVCIFGSNEAIEADITNDYVVTCQTPANSPGYTQVSLQFCEDGDCYSLATADRVTVPEKFTVAGVTSISPYEGSFCGGSALTISGFGFSYYDQLTVRFGDEAEVAATVINDNTLTCTTPDLSPLHVNNINFAECSNIQVVGKFGGSINFPMNSPISFEFGTPFPTEAIPNSADVDTVTEIVVNGKYFGGGNPSGTYFCQFGSLDPVPGYLYNYTEDGEVKYSLLCYTPSLFNTPDLTIGDYDLSIQFSCEFPSFTPLTIPFSFTQNPRIISFNPIAGTEVGGTQIQIAGRDLGGGSDYFCSFGTLGIDNQIVAAYYDSNHDVIFCQTPALVVDTNTLVDFHISIDGGENWILADDSYEYIDAVILCDRPFAPEPILYYGASSSLYPTLFVLFAVIFALF